MRGGASNGRGARVSAHFLVLTMLFASFLSFIPTAAAVVPGDLSIVEGITPIPDATYDRDTTSLYPSVRVKNDVANSHSPREIRWQMCEVDYVSSLSCPSNSEDGFTTTGTIYSLQEETVDFLHQNPFQPFSTGIHTVVFFFSENDNDQ